MRKLGILFATVFIFGLASRAAAQTDPISLVTFLNGEVDIDRPSEPLFHTNLQYTERILTIRMPVPSGDSILAAFEPDREVRIISACFKANDGGTVVVILSDGEIVLISMGLDGVWKKQKPQPTSLLKPTKVMGDALYVLNSSKPWASRDTGKTWSPDTLGIGKQTIVDIALDAQANVYAVSRSSELWFQHRDSSAGAWNPVPSFSSTGFPTALFIDRMGRMFVASTGFDTRVQVSTDTGKTWTNISDSVDEYIDAFGDDNKGNVYAVGQVSKAYRLNNLTPPWNVISDGITSLSQTTGKDKIITTIKGESTLYATTRFGIFTSSDAGDHWTHAPNGLQSRASAFYSPLVKAAGKYFLSSNLGVHRAADDGMSWEKVFPQDKYCSGINALSADDAGNLYGNFPIRIDAATSHFYPTKSMDQGAHWDLDTAGVSALGFNSQILDHYVDEQGTQWLGGNGLLYCKKPGQPWVRDTNGLGLADGMYIRQVSRNNKKGIVYTAIIQNGKYSIYSRAVADNTWTPVNADILSTRDGILHSDQNGNLIVKTLNFPATLWMYDGQWKSVPLPSSPSVSNFDQFLADGDGNLWITALGGPSGAPKGLWVSTDGGANWKMVGLDGVPVKFLSTDKDTVFAVTVGNGVFKFTKNSSLAGVASRPTIVPLTLSCQNQPNPFKPSTRIDFELPSEGNVTLSVLDLLGNEVSVLLQGATTAGPHSAVWDATGMPGGMYVCRLQYRQTNGGAEYSTTHKLLLLD
jgi:photosystem II stability/assembly factor-like uncharacterized protein